MKEKLRNIFLYGGVEKSEFDLVLGEINRANRLLVNVVSGFAAALSAVLFLLSFGYSGLSMNRSVYGVGFLISIAVLALSVFLSESYPKITGILVHFSIVVFYSYGIIIGTITDPSNKSAAFIGLIVLLQVIFTMPPVQTVSITVVCEAIFILMCFQTKTGVILQQDVVNGVIFGALGLASGIVITMKSVKSYVNALHAEEKSRIFEKRSRLDELTGLDNRNAFTRDLGSIPKVCRKSLSCVYIDANGLKTINDNEGHAAGDKMLKGVAGKIHEYFNEDFAYRVGGDEFVIFIPDIKGSALRNVLELFKSDVEEIGYHVAIGCDSQFLNKLSLSELTKNAEARMYKDKSEFYKNTKYERRKQ